MANFTQLNLQDKPKNQPERNIKPTQHPRFKFGTSAAVAGSFLVTTLVTLSLLNTEGCSKENKPVAEISSPASQPSPAMSMPSAPVVPPAATPKKASKKPVHHRPAVAMYSNTDYGLSFLYPRQYGLISPEKANLDWVPMNFVQPGGTTLAVVELPSGSFPETDLASALFNASVNRTLNASQCGQFAFPEKAKAETSSTENSAAGSQEALQPTKVKLGKREFSEVESLSGDEKQADAKYYHLYENGACYEFTVGLQTVTGDEADGITPVDRSKVFAKLERILSSVTIKSVEAPTVAATVPAMSETFAVTPATPTTSAPAASVATPAVSTSTSAVDSVNKPQ